MAYVESKRFYTRSRKVIAEHREEALSRLLAGDPVPFRSRSLVRYEIEACTHAEPEMWERLSEDERRAWLIDWVSNRPAREAALMAQRRSAASAQAALHPEVKVCRYKSKREFERDASRRLAEGWVMAAQSHDSAALGRRASKAVNGALLGSFITLPGLGAVVGASSRTDTFTVTWTRQPQMTDGTGTAAEGASPYSEGGRP